MVQILKRKTVHVIHIYIYIYIYIYISQQVCYSTTLDICTIHAYLILLNGFQESTNLKFLSLR